MRRSPTENDKLIAQIDAFMAASGKSLRTVAVEIAEVAQEPNGRTITKDRVNNFRNGRAAVPDWFLSAMDERYPGWRAKSLTKNSGQTSTENTDNEDHLRRRPMAVLPSLVESDMKNHLDQAKNGVWDGRMLPAPDLFGVNLPLQFIRNTDYAPSFLPGDALLLDPWAEAAIDGLYMIFADGAFCYAALSVVEGTVAWVKYNGTVIPFGDGMIEAALVVHLPQYDQGGDVGSFSRRGLKPGKQIPWPRPER